MLSKKRILKDYLEIQKCKNIFFKPLENNFYEWHGNLIPRDGRYKGLMLHVIIKLDIDYPLKPPIVRLCTYLPHSNVINYNGIKNYICLDMLNNFFWKESDDYSSWSSSYSLKTIIMQLECFLFDKYVENYDGKLKDTLYDLSPEEGDGSRLNAQEDMDRAFKEANCFCCTKCNHTKQTPFPEINFEIPKIKKLVIRNNLFNNKKPNEKLKKILKNIFLKNEVTILKNLIDFVYKYSTFDLDLFLYDYPYRDDCGCDFCLSYTNIKILIKNNLENFENFELFICYLYKLNNNYLWKILYNLNYNNNLDKKKIEIKKIVKKIVKKKQKQQKQNKYTILTKLPNDLLENIYGYLNNYSNIKLGRINKILNLIFMSPKYIEKKTKICYYSKNNYQEDILGYGINVEYNNYNKIKYINNEAELLSFSAFNNKLRKSIYNKKFNFFLPVIIDTKDFKKNKKLIIKSIINIYNNEKKCENDNENNDDIRNFINHNWESKKCKLNKKIYKLKNTKNVSFIILKILTNLMTSQIVKLMKGDDYISLKALEGYVVFHNLLLKLSNEIKELKIIANSTIKEFLKNCNKNKIENLGNLLSTLTISDYNWDDIKYSYFKESLDRNVLWIIRKNPELGFPNKEFFIYNDYRIKKSLEATLVGKKLLMFNIYFLENMNKISKDYNKYFGSCPRYFLQKFQNDIKKIYKLNSWENYFKYIKIKNYNKTDLANLLRNAFNNSSHKNYHSIKDLDSDSFIECMHGDKNCWTSSSKEKKYKSEISNNWRIKKKIFKKKKKNGIYSK